jgi:hypothetical protein
VHREHDGRINHRPLAFGGVTDVEAQGTQFFLDLDSNYLGRSVAVGFPLQGHAECVDHVIPTIANNQPPTHRAQGFRRVTVGKDFRMALAQGTVEFGIHAESSCHHGSFGTQARISCSAARMQWLSDTMCRLACDDDFVPLRGNVGESWQSAVGL